MILIVIPREEPDVVDSFRKVKVPNGWTTFWWGAQHTTLPDLRKVTHIAIVGHPHEDYASIAHVSGEAIPLTAFPGANIAYLHVCHGKHLHAAGQWKSIFRETVGYRDQIFWPHASSHVVSAAFTSYAETIVTDVSNARDANLLKAKLMERFYEWRRSVVINKTGGPHYLAVAAILDRLATKIEVL